MKRLQLAALAVGMTAGFAHAQSSVTLYGVADIGIEVINNVPKAGGGSASVVRMQPGNQSGSRFGLRGV